MTEEPPSSRVTEPRGARIRFAWKLTFVLVLLAAVVGATITWLSYKQAREILFRRIQSNVLSIAATAASQVDGDLHTRIVSEDQPEYATIRRKLVAIRDVNRRNDVNVRFLYTMRPTADGWEYVVDAEEKGPNHSTVGERVVFESESGTALTLGRAYAEDSFSKDEFGVWLSANAPIYNSQGSPVGMLGADIAADDVIVGMRGLLYAGVLALTGGMLAAVALALLVARWATRSLAAIREGLNQIAKGDFEHRVAVKSNDEFGDVADSVNRMAGELREREILKGTLTRYVSQDVVNQVLADREMPALRGQRRHITVLIADIRGFTALSQRIPPEALVAFLNRFLERMIEIILRHRGTLDKFLGDGVLAIFGAPLDDKDHRQHAIEAANEMLDAVDKLRESLHSAHGVDLRIGIALHCGSAVVGNIGSEQRMEYTAIGDVVNVTSRIESLNKEFGTELLVSDALSEGLEDQFDFRDVATVQPRGVDRPMRVRTVFREHQGHPGSAPQRPTGIAG